MITASKNTSNYRVGERPFPKIMERKTDLCLFLFPSPTDSGVKIFSPSGKGVGDYVLPLTEVYNPNYYQDWEGSVTIKQGQP